MAATGQPQFDINAKEGEVKALILRINTIKGSMQPVLDRAPPHLEGMIDAYFQRIQEELQAEEVKIPGIEANIQQYRQNLTTIDGLNTQKAQVEARIEAIRRQIDEETAKQYTPQQTAGGSKKRRKINPTTKMKIKKSSMKIKSSKSKDIRKIKKNKDKK